MPFDNPRHLFSKEFRRNHFHGIQICRRDGSRFLLPIHEITWVAATPLEGGGGGCVEIQARQRLIRLGLSRMDACLKFMDLLFQEEVNRIDEGTATISHTEPSNSPAATLVIEILDPEGSGETGTSPAPPARKPATRHFGLGFPSL